jgi:hypothetical protein
MKTGGNIIKFIMKKRVKKDTRTTNKRFGVSSGIPCRNICKNLQIYRPSEH